MAYGSNKRFDRRYEIGDARAVLRNHHRHFAGGAGKAVGHHTCITFMRGVPEGNTGLRE